MFGTGRRTCGVAVVEPFVHFPRKQTPNDSENRDAYCDSEKGSEKEPLPEIHLLD
jgi:hypothetical protein